MDWRLQLFLLACCLGFFAMCIHLLRKSVMEYKYALLWILGSLLMFVVVLFPKSLYSFSTFIGVIDPLNILFFVAFFISLLIIFALSVVVSKLSSQIRRLVQTVAILEKKISEKSENA